MMPTICTSDKSSAAEEFKNVYENLGDSIAVTQILAKIQKNILKAFLLHLMKLNK